MLNFLFLKSARGEHFIIIIFNLNYLYVIFIIKLFIYHFQNNNLISTALCVTSLYLGLGIDLSILIFEINQ